MVSKATATKTPQKIWVSRYLVPLISAPAIGVPIKIPRPAKKKLIPIRVPTSDKSEVNAATMARGRLTNVPLKKNVQDTEYDDSGFVVDADPS